LGTEPGPWGEEGHGSAPASVPTSSPSHGIFLGPLFGSRIILPLVILKDFGDFWDERIIRVGVAEEGADREK